MIRLTAKQAGLLEGFERTAFTIADTVNRRPVLKRLSHSFLRTFGAGWVQACTSKLQRLYGLEHIATLAPDRGVLIACNHRSFFDLYVISCVMLRHAPWINQMYFPVRSDYFYERPDGVVVNAVMSGLAMYPPVLRQPERRGFNQYVVDYVSDVSRRPGTLVGFHPEGTRNKTDDPYTLLGANPGVGQIIHQAQPIVIPAFILGLGNNLPNQIRGNFDGTGEPITIVFGAPLDLSSYYAEPARLRTYKRAADRVRAAISELGGLERQIRVHNGFPSKEPPFARTPRPSRDTTTVASGP